jgi:hypothetical protein
MSAGREAHSSPHSLATRGKYPSHPSHRPLARYIASLELQPTGQGWLVAPLALLGMRRRDQKNIQCIRETLESSVMMWD